MNQEYIAKNLCVQKDVEDNCCQGSCHLKEKLDEEDKKQEAPALPSFKDKSENQLFYQTFNDLILNTAGLQLSGAMPYLNTETISVSFSVFHPPKA